MNARHQQADGPKPIEEVFVSLQKPENSDPTQAKLSNINGGLTVIAVLLALIGLCQFIMLVVMIARL